MSRRPAAAVERGQCLIGRRLSPRRCESRGPPTVESSDASFGLAHRLLFVAAALFAFIPGPGLLYAAAQAMAIGRTIGLLGTLGSALGGCIHVIAATAGLSVVFHAVPPLHAAAKLIGAAYLVWLGILMIRAKATGAGVAPVVARKTGKRALVEGITLEMLNPVGIDQNGGNC